MNMLCDRLPTSIFVSGKEYPVNSDFRACVRIMVMFEDLELTDQEKNTLLYDMLFPAEKPEANEESMRAIMEFLNCGKSSEESSYHPKTYSLEKDAQYIHSAIRQTYGIDLGAVEYMHWWEFVAYLMDIGEDCLLCRMIALRSRYYEGKLSQEEKRYWAQNRALLEVPQPQSDEEVAAEDEFLRLLGR